MKRLTPPCLLYVTVMVNVLAACVNKDDTLLDLFPNEPIVNPAVGVLIRDSNIEYAAMTGINEIKGFSSSNYFETPDLFYDTLQIGPRPQGTSATRVIYQNPERTFYLAPYSFQFGISGDYGRSWTWHILQESYTPYADYIADVYGLSDNDQQYLVLASISNGNERSTYLYSYNGEQKTSAITYSFGAYLAQALHFVTDTVGWVLLKSFNGSELYISKTSDGGHSWTSPMKIDYMSEPKLIAGTPMHILIYDGAREASLVSTDGGYTFISGPNLSHAQYVSENMVYGIAGHLFYKSEDAGSTWSTTASSVYGQIVQGDKLSFFDIHHGIVYMSDRLFNTADGGNTWDIAVFPYDYVLDNDY